MKNLFRTNKFIESFYEVLSARTGDEGKVESFGPLLEIEITNPIKDFNGSLSSHRIAGV